jgi:hypothetical protein
MMHVTAAGMVADQIAQLVFGEMEFLSRAATESDIVVDTTWATIGVAAT